MAENFTVSGRQCMTDFLPGTFAVLADSAGNNYLGTATVTDLLGQTQTLTGYAYAAVLDTGASGCMLSKYEADARAASGFSLTGETYGDVGIGGTETFNVSSLTGLKLKAITGTSDTSEISVSTSYSPFGSYKFQVRQADPSLTIDLLGIDDPVYVNIVGTPVINQHVMHVKPNATAYSGHMDLYGFSPTEYVQTELLNSAPTSINASPGQLVLVTTGGQAIHVALNYEEFASGAPVTTSGNPMIAGVTVVKNGTSHDAGEWLLDSGASITMVSTALAQQIGIKLTGTDRDTPIASTEIMGVGGSAETVYGYKVDKLVVPTQEGSLTFSDITVFVLGDDLDLPVGLPGIFGMNLLNKSFSSASADGLSGAITYDNLTASAFSDWYVVPGSAVPEPGVWILASIGTICVWGWRFFRRRSGILTSTTP